MLHRDNAVKHYHLNMLLFPTFNLLNSDTYIKISDRDFYVCEITTHLTLPEGAEDRCGARLVLFRLGHMQEHICISIINPNRCYLCDVGNLWQLNNVKV